MLVAVDLFVLSELHTTCSTLGLSWGGGWGGGGAFVSGWPFTPHFTPVDDT